MEQKSNYQNGYQVHFAFYTLVEWSVPNPFRFDSYWGDIESKVRSLYLYTLKSRKFCSTNDFSINPEGFFLNLSFVLLLPYHLEWSTSLHWYQFWRIFPSILSAKKAFVIIVGNNRTQTGLWKNFYIVRLLGHFNRTSVEQKIWLKKLFHHWTLPDLSVCYTKAQWYTKTNMNIIISDEITIFRNECNPIKTFTGK